MYVQACGMSWWLKELFRGLDHTANLIIQIIDISSDLLTNDILVADVEMKVWITDMKYVRPFITMTRHIFVYCIVDMHW